MVKRALALLLVLTMALSTVSAYSYGDVLHQPAPNVPAFAVPGGNFTLYFKGTPQVVSIEAVSVLNGPYKLKILGIVQRPGENLTEVTVGLPDDIKPDTYFLLIDVGDTVVLPNGLRVFEEWPDTLKLAWTSDTHVTAGAKVGFVCQDYFQSSFFRIAELCPNPVPLHSVVATYSAYQYWAMNGATLIINTGDEIDTSGDVTGYNTMLDIISLTSSAGTSVLGIKGNHDDPPTVYTQVLGPRYFYVTIGKFLIIGLDTGGDRAHPTMDQIEWMEKVLEEHKGYIPIVLYHHPYFFNPRWNYLGGVVQGLDPSEDWEELRYYVGRYWGADEAVSKRFIEDVVKYNITLTMSGHIHHDMYWLYVDRGGNEHYFLTLTSTGAPDKEPNPPVHQGYSPTWYGSSLVIVDEKGNVEMPYPPELENGKVRSDFMSAPVPQKFMIFKHETDFGTALKFINWLEPVSGPIVLRIPAGASVDADATNVTYRVIASREIAGQYYVLLNVTIPVGVSQLVIDKEKDTEKPVVQIAYIQPSRPRPEAQFTVYFTAQDNLGVRDLYAVIYDSNGNPVKYGQVDKFPAQPVSGKPGDTFYIVELPGLEAGKYRLEVVAVDFYGNRAVVTKELTLGATATPTTPTTSAPSSGTCGPGMLVVLALLPLLRRRL